LELRYGNVDGGDSSASVWCDPIGVHVAYRSQRLTAGEDWDSVFDQALEVSRRDRKPTRFPGVLDDATTVVEASVAGEYSSSMFFSSERTLSDADRMAERLRSWVLRMFEGMYGGNDSGTSP
jgi:hypothetical protein